MNISTVIKLIVFGLSLTHFVNGQEAFSDTTIDALGNTERLHCDNYTANQVYPTGSVPTAWMLPDLTVLYANDSKHVLEDNKWTLAIHNVTRDDLGIYNCMMMTPSDEWFLIRLGLNAAGPYFTPLWDTYDLNTIIGLSAAGFFLLIVLLIYIINRVALNSQVSPDTTATDQHAMEEKMTNGSGVANSQFGQDNKAFESNDYGFGESVVASGDGLKQRVTQQGDEQKESTTTDL